MNLGLLELVTQRFNVLKVVVHLEYHQGELNPDEIS